jgi:hypothetical protein
MNDERGVAGRAAAQALQALDEVIPEHLRSSRHGSGFLGERYELLRKFIEQAKESAK